MMKGREREKVKRKRRISKRKRRRIEGGFKLRIQLKQILHKS